MPQIDQLMLAYASQWFWLLAVLAVIYFVIGKGMVPKISATVETRDRKIADDLAAAYKARADAEEAEATLQAGAVDVRAGAQSVTAAAKAKAAKDAAARVAKVDWSTRPRARRSASARSSRCTPTRRSPSRA